MSDSKLVFGHLGKGFLIRIFSINEALLKENQFEGKRSNEKFYLKKKEEAGDLQRQVKSRR